MSYSSDEGEERPTNGNAGAGGKKERWEDIQRSWDLVTEGADGSLAGMVEGLAQAGKRKRILRDTTPLQRGIIRHIAIIIDLSTAMTEKDLRPTRYLLTIRYVTSFITAFFEQNPISQLTLIGMRDGVALPITPLSGNPTEHITALHNLRIQEPKGNPSLQNALTMARGALFHSPSHGTREIIVIYGALYSADPGDIHRTISQLVTDSIRVNVVGLAARVAICQELCAQTNHTTKDDTSVYGVAMNEPHFRELLFQYITPPATRGAKRTTAEKEAHRGGEANVPSLLKMGFPNLLEEDEPTLCACHGNASRTGYLCPQCRTKVCGLPVQCPGCGMQLIQSTHLARSYHHLFPLRNFVEVTWGEVRMGIRKRGKGGGGEFRRGCVGCNETVFAEPPRVREDEVDGGVNGDVGMNGTHGTNGVDRESLAEGGGGSYKSRGPAEQKQNEKGKDRPPPERRVLQGASESGRYRCLNCGYDFCIHCDVLFHEVLHNCPGCLGSLG